MKPTFMDLTPAEYHLDYSALSKSMLWRFRKRRQCYKAEFVDCTRPPEKPTTAMNLGTLAHAGILHPESLETLYAIYPESVLGKGGRLGTNAAAEFEAEATRQGKICLKAEQLETVRAMVASVQGKLGKWLEAGSIREKPLYWENPETGLLCRCMADWIIPRRDVVFVFDLKTTSSAHPDEFERKVREYGYWFQDRHYVEGIQAFYGLPVQFRFVVVESDYPYTCSVQEICQSHLADATAARLKTLRDLAHCMVTGNWTEPWEGDVNRLVLRPGAFDEAA